MSNQKWQTKVNQELEMARAARQAGNEGRARVCARRAAGHIIGEYLARNKIDFTSESAIDRLRFMQSSPTLPDEHLETIGHFLVHTTPDHELPINADLVDDVNLLARQLLGESLP